MSVRYHSVGPYEVLSRLPGDPPSFRYHQLFREFLQNRLHREQPEEYRRLHAEEPYRLKCCFIRQRLRNTAERLRDAGVTAAYFANTVQQFLAPGVF